MLELFDVVDAQLIFKWCKEIEANDDCVIMKAPIKGKQDLSVQLSDEQKNLLNIFEAQLINKMEYMYYEICRRLFYFGLKAGMDMQAALSEE